MIGIPAEKITLSPETEPIGATDGTRPASPAVDRLFESEFSDLHARDVAYGSPAWQASGARAGRTLAVDPAWGEGFFWYYAIDDCMAVSVYDATFTRACGFDAETQSCFGLGAYGSGMVPYFDVEGAPADRTLLGYVWPARRYQVEIEAGTHLEVMSIMLLSPAIARLSARLGRNPSTVARAIASLDGTRSVPELLHVLDDIRAARVGPRTAGAFYGAKITEALCLLMDWYDTQGPASSSLRPEDRAAIDRARTYLAENLDRTVSAGELAEVALVSARKLLRLFKRVEGCSPRAYAQELRMERARELLRTTDAPMADIARSLGFTRQGSFSEAFRRSFGCTPRDYRAGRE